MHKENYKIQRLSVVNCSKEIRDFFRNQKGETLLNPSAKPDKDFYANKSTCQYSSSTSSKQQQIEFIKSQKGQHFITLDGERLYTSPKIRNNTRVVASTVSRQEKEALGTEAGAEGDNRNSSVTCKTNQSRGGFRKPQ